MFRNEKRNNIYKHNGIEVARILSEIYERGATKI